MPQSTSAFTIQPGGSRTHLNEPKNTKKRSHTAFTEDDSDEDDTHEAGKPQVISFFGDDVGNPINPLIIPPQKNTLVLRPRGNPITGEEQVRRKQALIPGTPGTNAEETRLGYGLTAPDIVREGNTENEIEGTRDGVRELISIQKTSAYPTDEEALNALLGNKQSDFNIPTPGSSSSAALRNENEIDDFRSDVASRPNAASIADYAATPILGFGAALLRGMGWKEGDAIGRRKCEASTPRILEKRAAGLGIGATEVPEEVSELRGEAPRREGRERGLIDRGYNPLMVRNARTGEIVTEEEFLRRQADGNMHGLGDHSGDGISGRPRHR